MLFCIFLSLEFPAMPVCLGYCPGSLAALTTKLSQYRQLRGGRTWSVTVSEASYAKECPIPRQSEQKRKSIVKIESKKSKKTR